MPSRAMRIVVAISVVAMFAGASVAQAAPGGPWGAPPGHLVSGKLSIVHADDFEDSAGHVTEVGSVPDHVLPDMQYWLQTESGEELLLEFPGHPPEATPGADYDVRGQRDGRSFHVAEMNAAAKGGGSGGGGKPQPTPSPTYVGQRDMLAIPFTFKGNTTPLTFTQPQIRENGFGSARSVKTYYQEASSTTSPGLTFNGDVTPIFEITGATDRCDYSGWASAAKTAATNAGWNLSTYEHLVFIFPKLVNTVDGKGVPVCEWSGLANVGGPNSWLNGTIAIGTWVHEIGHNVTLHHSSALMCPGGGSGSAYDVSFVSVASRCSADEYGDPFDVMGRSTNQRHFNGRNKAHLAWIPGMNVATVAPTSQPQEFTLQPIEANTTGLQLLQIPRGREFLYVDVRRPSGTFDAYGPSDDAVTGVLIRSGVGITSNAKTYLIDTAIYPTTTDAVTSAIEPDFTDAALQVGEGFLDTTTGTYIETKSLNPDGSITVSVRNGVSNVGPDARPTSGSALMLPGVPHQAPTVEATDVNKNLGMYRWAFESCPATCPDLTSGAEGAVSGGQDSITGPTYIPNAAGTYRLGVTVWDATGTWVKIILSETAGV